MSRSTVKGIIQLSQGAAGEKRFKLQLGSASGNEGLFA